MKQASVSDSAVTVGQQTTRAPTHPSLNAWLLCAPSLFGTTVFLIGVVTAPFLDYSSFDPFRPATPLERLQSTLSSILLFGAWFGATLGPLLIPVAAHQAVRATAALSTKARASRSSWTAVACALAAMAIFWGWLIHLEIMP